MASLRTLSFYLHEFRLQSGSFSSMYMKNFTRSTDSCCCYGSNEFEENGSFFMVSGELICFC